MLFESKVAQIGFHRPEDSENSIGGPANRYNLTVGNGSQLVGLVINLVDRMARLMQSAWTFAKTVEGDWRIKASVIRLRI
jgi:hypothetical protein